MCRPCSSIRPFVTATGRALAAESPAPLVDGDRVEAIPPAGLAESPGGGQTGHAAAKDRNPGLWIGSPEQRSRMCQLRPCFTVRQAARYIGQSLPRRFANQLEMVCSCA